MIINPPQKIKKGWQLKAKNMKVEEKTKNNILNDFGEFCRSKQCAEYIEWDCGEGICQSCKLVGQSYYVNEYPKDCLHFKDITFFEKRINRN